MKLRLLLILGFLSFFGLWAKAQCAAYGYFTQSGAATIFYDSSYSVNGHDAYWTFGDGGTGFGTQAFHTYTTNGTYTACLYIYDSIANCADTTCFTLTVSSYSSCSATFSFTEDSVNSLLYYLNGSSPPSGGSVEFLVWDFGSNDTSYYNQYSSHLFPNSGTYKIYYIVSDSNGQVCDSSELTITVSSSTSSCNASFTYNIDSINVTKHYFYGSTPPSGGSAVWHIHGNSYNVTYTGQNLTIFLNYTGSYGITYLLYDNNGNLCDSAYSAVSVSSGSIYCNASFSYAVDNANPYKLNFTNTSTNAHTAYWWFGGNSNSTQFNPSFTFATTGYHTVCLTTYDSLNNFCDSICQQVYVSGSSASCNAYFLTSVSGNTVNFYDTASSGNILAWDFGDSTYGNTSNPSHTYATSGTYYACLYIYYIDTAGDTLLCDWYCQTITVGSGNNCDASFNFSVDSMNTSASSYPVSFYHNSDTTLGFLWTFGDGSSSTQLYPTHTYTSAGTYTVCLKVITGYDSLSLPIICDSSCQTLTVGGTSGCQASFYLGVDTANLFNLYIITNSTGTTSSTTYYWDFGDSSTSTAQYPTHQYSSFGLYNLCLTILDSSTGCYSTYCDSIGLDSNGNLLKRDGFGITVLDEKDVLDIEDLDILRNVNIYPNPSNGLFTLNLDLYSAESIEISAVNSFGQTVVHKEITGYAGANVCKLDMAEQVNGLYFINIKVGNQLKNVKVFINR